MRNSYHTGLGIDGIIALLEFRLLFHAYSLFRQEPNQVLKPPIAPILALIAYFCAESRPAYISRRIDIGLEQHLIKKIPMGSALLPIAVFVLFQRHQCPVPTNLHMFYTAYIFLTRIHFDWTLNHFGRRFQKDAVSDSLISCGRKADSCKNMGAFKNIWIRVNVAQVYFSSMNEI